MTKFTESERQKRIQTTTERASDNWDDILTELNFYSEKYASSGWKTLRIYPMDVVPLYNSPYDVDILLPDNHFEQFADLISDGTTQISESEIYTGDVSSLQIVLLILKDPNSLWSIFLPIYFDMGIFKESIQNKLECDIVMRRSEYDNVITFQIEGLASSKALSGASS